jgi:hypothetical protein
MAGTPYGATGGGRAVRPCQCRENPTASVGLNRPDGLSGSARLRRGRGVEADVPGIDGHVPEREKGQP